MTYNYKANWVLKTKKDGVFHAKRCTSLPDKFPLARNKENILYKLCLVSISFNGNAVSMKLV